MIIEYKELGDIRLEIDNHSEVLHPARMGGADFDIPILESDITGKPALVQAIFNAMKGLARSGDHRVISFDTKSAIIKADGEVLTPDSDVSGFNLEVQTFINTVYSFDTGRFAEIHRLKQKQERGVVQKTKTVLQEQEPVIEVVGGKAVRRTPKPMPVEVPVVNVLLVVDEAGEPVTHPPAPIMDPKTGQQRRDTVTGRPLFYKAQQMVHEVPVIDEEQTFNETDAVKLAELLAKEL